MRAPLSYLILAAVIIGIMLWGLLLATGSVEVESLLTNFITFIAQMVLGTVMAVLLAVVLGMHLSRRILVHGRATPFEEGMLEMKANVEDLDNRLCRLGRKECDHWPRDPEMPHPGRFRRIVPKAYWAVLAAIILLTLWNLLLLTEVIVLNWDLTLQFIGFTSMLVVLMIGAVVGAFFFGMFLSHRIITRGSFTPFETTMMEMKEELSRMEAHIALLEEEKGIGKAKAKDEGEEG